MHSPQVRHLGSSTSSPFQACKRTSIPIGQLKEQIPHWIHRSGSGTTCPVISVRMQVIHCSAMSHILTSEYLLYHWTLKGQVIT